MKNLFLRGMALLAAASMLLVSCGKKEETSVSDETSVPEASSGESKPEIQLPSNPAEAESSSQPEGTEKYDDSRISELIAEEKNMKVGEDSFDFSYHIPQIGDDSPDAETINREIQEALLEPAEVSLNNIAAGEFPARMGITWESFWADSLLSLVISEDYGAGSPENYVYNYDFQTGKLVSNAELIKRAGCFNEEQYLHAVRRTAAQQYDTIWDYAADDLLPWLLEQRRLTIAEDNLTMDLPVYLDGGTMEDGGRLKTEIPIYTMAGGGIYYEFFEPDLKLKKQLDKFLELDSVSVTIKDGEPTVLFTKEDVRLPQGTVVGKPYPVHGLYGTCKDAFLLMQGASPYLFIIYESGLVDCADLYSTGMYDYCCMTGPLPGMAPIVSLEEVWEPDATGHGIPTVVATDVNGDRHDLGDTISRLRNVVPNSLTKCTWATEDDSDCMTCMDDRRITLQRRTDDGKTLMYEGSYTYEGMNEEGILCSYLLLTEDSKEESLMQGLFVMHYDINDWDRLHLKVLSGSDIFGLSAGEEAVLLKSVG